MSKAKSYTPTAFTIYVKYIKGLQLPAAKATCANWHAKPWNDLSWWLQLWQAFSACNSADDDGKGHDVVDGWWRMKDESDYCINCNLIHFLMMNVDSRWYLRDSIGGDIQRIQSASLQELLTWRNIRGRTVTHVAAACSQAGVWVGENFIWFFNSIQLAWKLPKRKYECHLQI